MEVKCPLPDCAYQTEDVDETLVNTLIVLHVQDHQNNQSSSTTNQVGIHPPPPESESSGIGFDLPHASGSQQPLPVVCLQGNEPPSLWQKSIVFQPPDRRNSSQQACIHKEIPTSNQSTTTNSTITNQQRRYNGYNGYPPPTHHANYYDIMGSGGQNRPLNQAYVYDTGASKPYQTPKPPSNHRQSEKRHQGGDKNGGGKWKTKKRRRREEGAVIITKCENLSDGEQEEEEMTADEAAEKQYMKATLGFASFKTTKGHNMIGTVVVKFRKEE